MDTCKALSVPVIIVGLIIGYMFALDFAFNFFRANPGSLAFVGAALVAVIIFKHKTISTYFHNIA